MAAREFTIKGPHCRGIIHIPARTPSSEYPTKAKVIDISSWAPPGIESLTKAALCGECLRLGRKLREHAGGHRHSGPGSLTGQLCTEEIFSRFISGVKGTGIWNV